MGSLLDDQQWHGVKLERLSSHINLTVDKNTHQVQVPAELSDWDIHQVSPPLSCLVLSFFTSEEAQMAFFFFFLALICCEDDCPLICIVDLSGRTLI